MDFGSKFVNQKQKQLRLAAFAEVNKLSTEFPRVKIAILMRAYRKAAVRSWFPIPENGWMHAADADLRKLEAVLHYFQVMCKSAVADMEAMQLASFNANVATIAAETFAINFKHIRLLVTKLMEKLKKFYDEAKVHAKINNMEMPIPAEKWMVFELSLIHI